jgi:redox-regulated HSP33 family molecular chaperone
MVDMRSRLNALSNLTRLRKLQSPAVTKELSAIEKAAKLVGENIAQNKITAHDVQVQGSLKLLLEKRKKQRNLRTMQKMNDAGSSSEVR